MSKINNYRNLNSEDDLIMLHNSQPLGFSVKSKSFNNFMVHINTEIKSPDHYSKVFEKLLDASEDDLVEFYITSPGGRLDGLSVLLEGIRLSDAVTRAVLIGEASSAASILALNCQEVFVTDSSEMLCHSCLYSTGGKAADISAHVNHTTKITERLLRETYSGFMSEQEIFMMLQGTQWYFDAEQIRERLALRAAYLMEKEKVAEEVKPETVPEPKKTSKQKEK